MRVHFSKREGEELLAFLKGKPAFAIMRARLEARLSAAREAESRLTAEELEAAAGACYARAEGANSDVGPRLASAGAKLAALAERERDRRAGAGDPM